MKVKFFAIGAMIFMATSAFAQTVVGPISASALPTSLSGEWHAKNTKGIDYSAPWAVRLDSNGTGVLDVKSGRPGCDIHNAPIKVEYDGMMLKITVINPNGDRSILPCSLRWVAELKRQEPSNVFNGQIWSDVVGAANNPVFVTLQ